MFRFPIGLLLFNRPEYAEEVLRSLKNQSVSFDHERLFIYIDGYVGSKDEAQNKPDSTAEVIRLAESYFPEAAIRVFDTNKGIAQIFSLLEAELFSLPQAEWALFLEEDFVLYPDYLMAIESLITNSNNQSEIVVVSATGDTRIRVAGNLDILYPLDHLWAFALKKEHYLQRLELMRPYLDLIKDVSYWKRDREQISKTYSNLGIFLIGSSQDYVKRAIISHFGKLAVTTGRKYGAYIGARGEHYEESIFVAMGYGTRPPVPKKYYGISEPISPQISRLFHDAQKSFADDALSCTVLPLIEAENLARVQKESIEKLVHENALLREDSARLNYEVMVSRDVLNNVMSSTSWKFTKPLRIFSRILRRK